MLWWIGGAVLGGHLALLIFRFRLGLAAYFLLSLVAPHVHLGSQIVSYEILAAPLVLGVIAITRRVSLRPYQLSLLAFLGVLTLATLVSVMFYRPVTNLVSFAGNVRAVLLLIVVAELMWRRDVERVLSLAILVNAGLAVIQVAMPASVSLFHAWYYKADATSLGRYLELGFFPRATGTFGSPLYLGGLALVCFAIFGTLLLTGGEDRWSVGGFVASLMAGIASLSRTFLLGAPVVLAVAVLLLAIVQWRSLDRVGRRWLNLSAISLAVLVPAVLVGLRTLERLGLQVETYLWFLLHPQATFATRYGTGGMVESTMAVLREHPVIGVGTTQIQNEFIGDSMYVATLHDAGFLGLGLLLVTLMVFITMAGRQRSWAGVLAVVTVMVAGVANSLLPNIIGVLGVGYAGTRMFRTGG